MIHVRRHKRQTASGKTVTVRAHERDGGDDVREVPEWSRPASAADFRPSATVADEHGTSPEFRAMFLGEAPAGDWWDDDAGERQEKLRALRESGWDGPWDLTDSQLEILSGLKDNPSWDAEPDNAPEFNSPAAREELRAARAELERVSKGLREETEEYHAANRRVIEAEKHVTWWRR